VREFTMQATADTSMGLSLLMLDIDHFKRFNDEYGHLLGDRVIRGVARAMESSARPDDVVCRYGGEEFAVLLPATGLRDAAKIAERIRLVVSRAYVRRVDSEVPVGGVTISAGVTASVVKRFMSLTLPPDENTVPAPVRIITRTDGSALIRSTAATNSSTAALPVSALRTSGAFIVSVTTAPLCS